MPLNITRATIRAVCAASMLCATTLPAFATTTLPPGPVEANFSATLSFGAGSSNTSGIVATVPTGHRLVVQSISIYRSGVASGSILNSFLVVPEQSGSAGYLALPEVIADGSPFPSTTLTTTAYLNASAAISFNLYRSGSATALENDVVTVIGYYVAAQ